MPAPDDIPFLRCIPNVSIACPADEAERYRLLSTAYEQDHAGRGCAIPRGAGIGTVLPSGPDALQGLPCGKGELRRQGRILAFGTLPQPALQAG